MLSRYVATGYRATFSKKTCHFATTCLPPVISHCKHTRYDDSLSDPPVPRNPLCAAGLSVEQTRREWAEPRHKKNPATGIAPGDRVSEIQTVWGCGVCYAFKNASMSILFSASLAGSPIIKARSHFFAAASMMLPQGALANDVIERITWPGIQVLAT